VGFIKLKKHGWATRNCPNVIIKPLANSGLLPSAYLTDSWGGWPANYSQIVASTAEEYLVSHAFLCGGLGAHVTTNGFLDVSNHMHLQIGKGAAGSETVIAEAMTVSSVNFILAGIVDDAVICEAYEKMTHRVPLAPVIVPAASRLAVRGQISGAPTLKTGAIYLAGYPTAALDYAHVPAFDELFMRGCRPAYSDIQVITAPVTVTASVTAWALGAWVQIGAALDDDYLFEQGAALGDIGAKSGQFDVGLGPDDTHIVVQARYAIASEALQSAADDEFLLPFIAYKGEKVWVRVASKVAFGKTFNVCLHAKRLS